MNGQRYLHPDDDSVYACPHCDNAPIHKRNRDNVVIDPDQPFICYECKQGFGEPVERKSRENAAFKANSGSRSAKNGLAAKLEAMDPEEVGI